VDRDTARSPHVIMISEGLALRLWPHSDPIGRRIDPGFSNAGWYTVVGVVSDVKQFGLSDAESLAIYLPYQQSPIPFLMRDMTLVLRTSSDPMSAVPAVRHAIESVDPELPLFDVASMEQLLNRSVSEPRLNTVLLAAFAALALILATVGIYGVMSYTVSQRTREIGVRMALGAGRAEVLRGVLAQGAGRAFAGIAIGLAGSLILTRFLSTLLFGVRATDPVTYIGVAALLSVVAFLASYTPARRATRVDPMAALRCE
jgi:putative ABC transport system permease protein